MKAVKMWKKKVIMRDMTEYAIMVYNDWVIDYMDNPEIEDGQTVKQMSEDYNCKYEYLLEVIKLGAKIVCENPIVNEYALNKSTDKD